MISLVAGGAGFLGSHLADALLQGGDEVIIIDNLSTGNLRNIEQATQSKRCTFVFYDIVGSVGTLRSVLEPVLAGRRLDRIFHVASPAGYNAIQAAAWETLTANSGGTLALVDLAVHHGAAMLYASTPEFQQDSLAFTSPDVRDASRPASHERSAFLAGKRFGEAAITVATQTRGLNGSIVRLYNCYGPRMASADGRLIPSWLAAVSAQQPLPVHGSGLQKRSMTYVSDAVEAMLTIIRDPQPFVEPIHFGSNDERTVLELARAFAHAAGTRYQVEHLPDRAADSQRVKLDLSHARSLGCAPRTDLEAGLRNTLEWFRLASPSYV